MFKSDAGDRLITATATDRVTAERRVRVQRGKRSRISFELQATPEARFGTVVLVAPRSADTLEIIGVAQARGRLERDVKPGRYRVRLAGEHGTRETALSVRARSVVRYEFDEARETSFWKSPVFWASAAGAVAAVTVGVLLVVGRPRDDPVRDREFGVVGSAFAPVTRTISVRRSSRSPPAQRSDVSRFQRPKFWSVSRPNRSSVARAQRLHVQVWSQEGALVLDREKTLTGAEDELARVPWCRVTKTPLASSACAASYSMQAVARWESSAPSRATSRTSSPSSCWSSKRHARTFRTAERAGAATAASARVPASLPSPGMPSVNRPPL